MILLVIKYRDKHFACKEYRNKDHLQPPSRPNCILKQFLLYKFM